MHEYEICLSGFPKKDVRVPISQNGHMTFWQDATHFEALFAPVHTQHSKFLEIILVSKWTVRGKPRENQVEPIETQENAEGSLGNTKGSLGRPRKLMRECWVKTRKFQGSLGRQSIVRAMVWWLERLSYIRKVEGSNPPSGTLVRAVGKGQNRNSGESKPPNPLNLRWVVWQHL